MSIAKVYRNFEIIHDKSIVVIGAGGLGCVVADLLARMGITFTVIDNDIVDNTNLERQIMFGKEDLLRKKVHVIKQKLASFAPIIAIDERVDDKNIADIVGDPDLIIDCTDNVDARHVINRYALQKGIAWIYSGAVSNIGTVLMFRSDDNSPCFACINNDKNGDSSCEIGVLNSIVTIVGAWTVNLALQYLIEAVVEDHMIRINLRTNEFQKIRVPKNRRCKVCKK